MRAMNTYSGRTGITFPYNFLDAWHDRLVTLSKRDYTAISLWHLGDSLLGVLLRINGFRRARCDDFHSTPARIEAGKGAAKHIGREPVAIPLHLKNCGLR